MAESRRLGALIEGLLEIAQMDSGRAVAAPRPADLVGVVREAIDSFEGDADPLEVDLPASPVEAWIDPQQLRRLLRQLILNAADHGGSTRGVRVTLRPTPSGARLAVRDWGPGIAPNDLERIFDPFFRGRISVEDAPTGTGLGLPLCRQIVERHGGTIWAELPPDGGLRIVVELPGRGPDVPG
jgi:signal transduction histidine kinase